MRSVRKRASPTSVIESFSAGGEGFWFKRPRAKPRLSMRESFANGVTPGKPRVGERSTIHSHEHGFGKFQAVLPNIKDLSAFVSGKLGPARFNHIPVRVFGRVVGYSVVRIPEGKREALRKVLENPYSRLNSLSNERDSMLLDSESKLDSVNPVKFKRNFQAYLRELRKHGVIVRFVPNRKAGYRLGKQGFEKQALKGR